MVIPQRIRWYLLPLALVPLAVIRASLMAEPDTFWQIRVGQDILRTGRIPHTDTYSWTAYGAEWHPNSWAFDVLLAWAYRAGGLTAVALAAAVFIPLAGLTVALLARRLGPTRPALSTLIVFVGFVPLLAWFSARPQVVDYVAVPLLLLLLDVAFRPERSAHRWAALAGVGVLQVVWVNLHLVAPIGVALAATMTAGRFVGRGVNRRDTVLTGLLAVSVTSLGTLVNPFGWRIAVIAADVHDSAGVIKEWGHFTPTDPLSDVLLTVAVLGAVAAWRLRLPHFVLPSILLIGSGLYAKRMLPIAAIVGVALLVAVAMASTRRRAYADSRRTLIRFALISLVLGEAVLALVKGAGLSNPRYPVALAERVPSDCRLFTSYTLGGLIILLRPEILVSQDSRTDLYGRAFLITAHEVEFSEGLTGLEATGADCVFIEPASPLAVTLATAPEWRSLGDERNGVLFVKNAVALGD
ncbi:MAG: hypothetical protein HOV79_33330 [Hamadaea sp.]|nr:hypothetical protein [Hamadaea sp.]